MLPITFHLRANKIQIHSKSQDPKICESANQTSAIVVID